MDKQQLRSWQDNLATLPQYLIPQHRLSILMHRLANTEITWLKQALIDFIVARYQVNVSEAAATDLTTYPSFNAFFTRQLKQGVRTITPGDTILTSPVDGVVSQIGTIESGRIIQAKGRDYSVLELLGADQLLAKQFNQGQFATLYLSPKDYHRIHMPLAGTLQRMRYIPGKLFSVNPRTVRSVPKLFARNERVITLFETALGPMIIILVGAIFVGSIATVWSGQITPPYRKQIQDWYYSDDSISLAKGEEMGRFNMGSTVIILLPKQMKKFSADLVAGQTIQLGDAMVDN